MRDRNPAAAALRAALLAIAALTPAGCAALHPAPAISPNPTVVPVADFDTVWNATVRVVDEYFDVKSPGGENRLARRIVTEPVTGATLLEPWHRDSVGFDEKLESTIQTIRRFAIVHVDPAPGGGWAVRVEVFKELEDLPQPERQTGGRAAFVSDYPVNRTREIVGPVPLPADWIPRGRDPKLEQRILERIRAELGL